MQINQIIEGWSNLVKDKLNLLHPPIKAVASGYDWIYLAIA